MEVLAKCSLNSSAVQHGKVCTSCMYGGGGGGSMGGQGRVFNYEDGDGQPDNTLMLIRS